MTDVLLSPHNDDAELFACATLLRYRPHVVVCLRSHKQAANGITADERLAETRAAMDVLGCSWEQWYLADDDNEIYLELQLRTLLARVLDDRRPSRLFAPAVEDDGHEQHSLVGRVARQEFENVVGYATYRRGHSRTRTEFAVPFDTGWAALKMRALACYVSQIDLPATRPWFVNDWLDEFYVYD